MTAAVADHGRSAAAGRPRLPGRRADGLALADGHPRAGFRAVSGLILTLFVTAMASGITTPVDNGGRPIEPGSAAMTSPMTKSQPTCRLGMAAYRLVNIADACHPDP